MLYPWSWPQDSDFRLAPLTEAENLERRLAQARRWQRKRSLWRVAVALGLRRRLRAPRHERPQRLDAHGGAYYPRAFRRRGSCDGVCASGR